MKFSSKFSTNADSRSIPRRNLLKIVGNLFGFSCASLISWFLWRFTTSRIPRTRNVLFKSIPREGEVRLIDNVYLVSNHGRLTALSAKCTHLGCIINYSVGERMFRCPCHGSVFDINGDRVFGPASQSLEKFAYKVEKNGSVLVKKSL